MKISTWLLVLAFGAALIAAALAGGAWAQSRNPGTASRSLRYPLEEVIQGRWAHPDGPGAPSLSRPESPAPQRLPPVPLPDPVSLPGLDAPPSDDAEVSAPQEKVDLEQPSDLGPAPAMVCRRLPPIAPAAAAPPAPLETPESSPGAPTTDRAWWNEQVVRTSLLGGNAMTLTVDQLVEMTLANSPRLQVIRLQPAIERQAIGEAEGRFDWNVFLRNRWLDTSRPAGSELDVGVPRARFLERDLQSDVGLRRVTPYGGQFEASQVLQGLNNNSVFFIPDRQALTNLTLRYSQPLLRDRGTIVNQGQVYIARHIGDAAAANARGEVADHLLQVVEAYWDVYRLRAGLAIQTRLYESTLELLEQLRRRQQVDASRVMIVQAEATALSREAGLAGAAADLRRAQNQLARLVGPSTLDQAEELISAEEPFHAPLELPLDGALATAVQNRPEIGAAVERIKAAEIGKTISSNQLLPQLALVLENSLFGLRGDYDLASSWWDQFSRGRPTWAAGLTFEYPLENRAAMARYRRAELEAAREVAAMADVVQEVRLDVKNALVDLQTAYQQLQIRRAAMEKAIQELQGLERRRQLFPDTDRVAILFLQDLLESQQRRATAEREYVETEAAYAVAILRLRRAEGTLWQEEQAR